MSLREKIRKQEFLIRSWDNIKKFYYIHMVNDEKFVKKEFKQNYGRELDLDHPVTFNEKIQWLKLYWRDPKAVIAADKYLARDLIAEEIGPEYLNDLLGVYEDVDEINIEELPQSFVLKGNHASGYNIIVKDKDKMNWDNQFRIMRRWLNNNFALFHREWVYKNIKPRIVCEKFLTDEENEDLKDYKIYCFNGEPYYCQVIQGRENEQTLDFFDTQWKHMPFTGLGDEPNADMIPEKPEKYEEMLKLAKILSKDFPFVRVDFYYVNNKIIFGELTFYPHSGFGSFKPEEWNEKIGALLDLPEK